MANLELFPTPNQRVLKVTFTDLLWFGNASHLFFVGSDAESVHGVSFLEPSEGVTLVNGDGHMTEFK